METNSNNMTNDGANKAEKMLIDSTKELPNFYTTQFNIATSFYKNLLDLFSTENKGWNTAPNFSNSFLKNDFTNGFAIPSIGISNNSSNPFIPTFDKLYKQMVDYNTTMYTNLTDKIKRNADLSDISEKYQDRINNRIEFYNSVLKTAIDTSNKQLDYSIETNKKAIEEMNNQIHAMVKQNQQFWSELNESAHKPTNNEGKINKDSISTEIKKRANILATELTNHKV